MEKEEILRINAERQKALNKPYNPRTGTGSPIARFRLPTKGKSYMLLPKSMKREPYVRRVLSVGAVDVFARLNRATIKSVKIHLIKLRLVYDFEYWCAVCVKIQDKETKEMVPFVMRRP